MHAVRNTAICLKDCLCLYICPNGATDTESGQIDAKKCTGCGMCANACPAHAITIMPEVFPVQQPKAKKVIEPMYVLTKSWAKGELIADYGAATLGTPIHAPFDGTVTEVTEQAVIITRNHNR